MAERAGFEPAVHLLSVRAFSKRLVSATHPPSRGRYKRLEIKGATREQAKQENGISFFHILLRMLDFLKGGA